MPSKVQSGIEPPSPFSALKYRPLQEVAALAKSYHRLISELRFGEAIDKYWDEAVVMRWANGRVFRGLGPCAAFMASKVHKAEPIRYVYDEPVIGSNSFLMSLVTRQRLIETGEVIEISRTWGHKVRKGKIIEISEHLQSLAIFVNTDGTTADPADESAMCRQYVPFETAVGWLAERGI